MEAIQRQDDLGERVLDGLQRRQLPLVRFLAGHRLRDLNVGDLACAGACDEINLTGGHGPDAHVETASPQLVEDDALQLKPGVARREPRHEVAQAVVYRIELAQRP